MKTRTNLWNTLLALLAIFVSATAFTACSNDDDDNNNSEVSNKTGGSGDNTENKIDYTATTSVKTVTLKEYHKRDQGNVTVYEEFGYKYDLVLFDGGMGLCPYHRSSGAWALCYYSSSYLRFYYSNINIKDYGKMNSISDVTEKVAKNTLNDFPAAQPEHGYSACFLTENETKHLRLYISNYKLDSEGALESITVQYQLY